MSKLKETEVKEKSPDESVLQEEDTLSNENNYEMTCKPPQTINKTLNNLRVL